MNKSGPSEEKAPSLLAFLQAALEHAEPGVREQAAAILGKIGGAASEAVQPLLRALLRHRENPANLLSAISAIGLKEDDFAFILSTLDAKQQSSDKAPAPPSQDDASKTKVSDVWNLVQAPKQEAVPLLKKAAADPSASVRSMATGMLLVSGLQDETVIPLMVRSLNDPDPGVRFSGATGLGAIQSEAAVPHLIAALADPDPIVRFGAADGLGITGKKALSAVNALKIALKDADGDVRWQAAWALGEIGANPDDVAECLAAAISDEVHLVREAAVGSLAGMKTQSAESLAKLLQALEDSHPKVRKLAIEAIDKLGIVSESAVLAMLNRMWDEELMIRQKAAAWLEKRGISSQTGLFALVEAATTRNDDQIIAKLKMRIGDDAELLKKLRVFLAVGDVFESGETVSLRTASKRLVALKKSGKLSKSIPTSTSQLGRIIAGLEADVYAPVAGFPVRLFHGEGTGKQIGELTPFGRKLLQITAVLVRGHS